MQQAPKKPDNQRRVKHLNSKNCIQIPLSKSFPAKSFKPNLLQHPTATTFGHCAPEMDQSPETLNSAVGPCSIATTASFLLMDVVVCPLQAGLHSFLPMVCAYITYTRTAKPFHTDIDPPDPPATAAALTSVTT